MSHRLRTITALGAAALATIPFLVATNTAQAKPQETGKGYDVLFIRHAETDYAPPEEALNAAGIEQAAALTGELHDVPLDAVYTSMMVRSFQTGDGVAVDHDLPISADADLNEIVFDTSEGASREKVFQIMTDWLHGVNRDQGFGGESYVEVEQRWDRWWDDFADEHRGEQGRSAVVAHSALFSMMLPATCSNEIEPDFPLAHFISNTGIVRATLHPNGTLTCTEWDGTPIPSATED